MRVERLGWFGRSANQPRGAEVERHLYRLFGVPDQFLHARMGTVTAEARVGDARTQLRCLEPVQAGRLHGVVAEPFERAQRARQVGSKFGSNCKELHATGPLRGSMPACQRSGPCCRRAGDARDEAQAAEQHLAAGRGCNRMFAPVHGGRI